MMDNIKLVTTPKKVQPKVWVCRHCVSGETRPNQVEQPTACAECGQDDVAYQLLYGKPLFRQPYTVARLCKFARSRGIDASAGSPPISIDVARVLRLSQLDYARIHINSVRHASTAWNYATWINAYGDPSFEVSEETWRYVRHHLKKQTF